MQLVMECSNILPSTGTRRIQRFRLLACKASIPLTAEDEVGLGRRSIIHPSKSLRMTVEALVRVELELELESEVGRERSEKSSRCPVSFSNRTASDPVDLSSFVVVVNF